MKFHFLYFCLGLSFFMKAQANENQLVYGSIELNLGNYVGLDWNLNFSVTEKHSVRLGYLVVPYQIAI